MRKIIFQLLLAAMAIPTAGQVNTNTDGTVYIGSNTYRQSSFQTAKVNFESSVYNAKGKDLIGAQGVALMGDEAWSWDKAVGVLGVAGNAGSGHNAGVLGYLAGSKNGAAVYGSIMDDLSYVIPGIYAGFFRGDARVTGTLYCSSTATTSDLRLKRNVIPVSETEDGYSYLDRLLDMNVIEYNLVNRSDRVAEDGTVSTEDAIDQRRSIGLAAQELQGLFPGLVVEGPDGYLAVNYVELVPVLVRSIQELKQQLDELREARAMTRGTTDTPEVPAGMNLLYQITPTPLRDTSTIRFSLADGVRNASICIFDMQGKKLRTFPVSSGDESVSFSAGELGEGLYLYSLVINGQELDTKKMLVSQ